MLNRSYRSSFVGALCLHLLLLVFLLVKFTPTSKQFVTDNNIVKAMVVASNELVKTAPLAPPVRPEKPIVKPQPEEDLPPTPTPKIEAEKPKQATLKKADTAALEKHLLAVQAQELASIKKQVQIKRRIQAQDQLKKQALLLQKNAAAQLATEQQQLAAAQNSQMQGELDKYKAAIIQAISSRWIVPPGVDNNAVCQLLVNVGPGGVVLSVQITAGSGNPVLDRSAQTAVLKASPLPVPTETSLFDEFRVIKLTVRPEGIVTS